MAITKLSHKPFWERVGKNARDMIKKSIFDKGKNVYGSKWLDGKYSKAYGAKKAANKFKRQSSTKVAPVLTGDLVNDLGSFVKANPNGFILNQSIRRLTPIECERLQGFPDNWTKTGKELGEISDSQRYKMCGNAVTVDVVEAVAKQIKKAI